MLKLKKFGTISQRDDGRLEFDGFEFSTSVRSVSGEDIVKSIINYIADVNNIPLDDVHYDVRSEVLVIRALKKASNS
ncbi:hypothetical protein [Enterobacter cloacae complex sp. 372C4]|uniref:hypothetical protein n=1 Tax=unclassified Enterobacter cloacae complex TaxID=2757714 RepID=UPI003CECA685